MISEVGLNEVPKGGSEPLPIGVFEQEGFKEQFTQILRIAMDANSSSKEYPGTRNTSEIADMSDQVLVADAMSFTDSAEIKSECLYVLALCTQIADRKTALSFKSE